MRKHVSGFGVLSLVGILAGTGVACGPRVNENTGGGGDGGAGATGVSTVDTSTSTSMGGMGGFSGGPSTGGGGFGGFGGFGGGGPPANDKCPGTPLGLTIGTNVFLSGTLVEATDDYTTFCADTDPNPGSPDVAYQIDVDADATLTVQVEANGFDPAISLRLQECESRFGTDACLNLGATTEAVAAALPAGTYWLVVDSADGNVGSFTVTASLDAPSCGDGVINPGEQCDPATASDNDGCFNPGTASECQFGEPPMDTAVTKCNGGQISAVVGATFLVGPYNNGSGNDNAIGSCAPNSPPDVYPPPPNGALDNVFQITPQQSGTLTVQIGHDTDGTVYCVNHPADCADFIMFVRKGACDSTAPADELGCVDFPEPPEVYDVLKLDIPVTANTPYWVFVDGLDTEFYSKGTYYLEVSLAP